MKTLASTLIFWLLAGCYSTAPHKELDGVQINQEFEKMSGVYRVRDSRENKHTKVAAINLVIRARRGSAEVHREDGSTYTLKLWKCELANIAQAQNFGKPFESIESLVRCDILSNYAHAGIFVGKVKNDYVVSDGKMLKTFDPMQIKTGYVVSLKEGLGGSTLLSVSRD